MSNQDLQKTSKVIRITGDSGDGVQLLGEQITITAAVSGREVRTLPDFPAEIRAPAGTLAGVSGFQLAISDATIFTAGETLDVLVSLNPAALKHSIDALSLGGLLIINTESFTEKDWKKALLSPSFLDDKRGDYQIIPVQLISNVKEAVAGFDLSPSEVKKTKNFYVLGMILWLFDLPTEPSVQFIKEKFNQHTAIMDANIAALSAGYNYGITLELSKETFQFKSTSRIPGDYRQINGIDALTLALATITLKTNMNMLVAGYPITPASMILQSCAHLSDYGIALLQAEDEIAAICACLGAAFGGKLALTCTSGPGFDLKTESLGLAVSAELPLVVVDVQRAGVSTGLPTKTSQSDLNQALYGRHGEAPIPVMAAKSPSDCFNIIIEAFIIAIRYMTPVIVLLDAYLSNAAEPWLIPNPEDINMPKVVQNKLQLPYARDENNARSWNIPGTTGFIHQIGGLEKQGKNGMVSYDAVNYEQMIALRAQKIANIANQYEPLKPEGDHSAKTIIISWGSTYGSIHAAILEFAQENVKLAHLHLRHLNPLPFDLGDIIKRYELILVAELNTGHLWRLIRSSFLVDAKLISQCDGKPFDLKRLKAATLEYGA